MKMSHDNEVVYLDPTDIIIQVVIGLLILGASICGFIILYTTTLTLLGCFCQRRRRNKILKFLKPIDGDGDDCVICLESKEEMCKLKCGHTYHVDCIKTWLGYKSTCPLCICRV